MALSQHEEVIQYDDVPPEHQELIMTMLLDFLQLEVVIDRSSPEAQAVGMPIYTVRRRSEVEE